MFDIGWSELAVIAVVALVVIGPKDLPKVLRTVGYWVRKARTVASEFQSSIEQMAREAELADMKKQIETASKLDLKSEVEKAIDPDRALANSLEMTEPLPASTMPTIEAPVAEAPTPESSAAEPSPGDLAASSELPKDVIPPVPEGTDEPEPPPAVASVPDAPLPPLEQPSPQPAPVAVTPKPSDSDRG
jgi:sec-independent protein translocase protein TatB